MPADQQIETSNQPLVALRFVVILALLSAIMATVVGVLDPLALSVAGEMPTVTTIGWIFAQAYWLMIPALVSVVTLIGIRPAIATRLGGLLCLIVPLGMLTDAIVDRWIGQRLLSTATWRITTELRSGLAQHVTVNVVGGLGFGIVVGLGVAGFVLWSSQQLARRWATHRQMPTPTSVLGASLALAFFFTAAAAVESEQMTAAMRREPFRHPLCVARLVHIDQPAANRPPQQPQPSGQPPAANPHQQALLARDQRLRRVSLDQRHLPTRPADVLIVVIESFRRELVDPDVMPNLWRLAHQGIHCREHFSGGNATNHGIFSLLNGLEAIWYERPVRFTPLLNRLFRQAGYELGFFAGHDDWRNFYMDGYISEEQFDVLQTTAPDGLQSDRWATLQARLFLDADVDRPRLAVLYLYATHATYQSYSEDQIFQPAADERFLIPYTPAARPAIWNRYKNSARTVDRFLEAVIDPDRVTVVCGDHGESFLDDGTIGHGVRISAFQNMTPAVIYVPQQAPRVIDSPTMHADLLPTLLSAIGLAAQDSAALDGVDLLRTPEETLASRVFVTRNYLAADIALIGPWTTDPTLPFAYHGAHSADDFTVKPWGAIDPLGRSWPGQRDDAAWDEWIRR